MTAIVGELISCSHGMEQPGAGVMASIAYLDEVSASGQAIVAPHERRGPSTCSETAGFARLRGSRT